MTDGEWIRVSRWGGRGRAISRSHWKATRDEMCKIHFRHFGHHNHRCISCYNNRGSRLGHVVPIRAGGLFTRQNLRFTCDECESITGNQMLRIHPRMKEFHELMKR